MADDDEGEDRPLTAVGEPLTEEAVRARIRDPKLRIVSAPQDACAALAPFFRQILAGIREVTGISGAFVTDESYFSDFAFDADDYAALGKVLGIAIAGNMALVELAALLKAKAANQVA